MAYYDVALLSADSDFIQRTRAAVAVEGVADPVAWSTENQWAMAATPSFGDKYGYALETGVSDPGKNPAVIADAEILSAVQAIGVPAGALSQQDGSESQQGASDGS